MFEIEETDIRDFLESDGWMRLFRSFNLTYNYYIENNDWIQSSIVAHIFQQKKWAIRIIKENIHFLLELEDRFEQSFDEKEVHKYKLHNKIDIMLHNIMQEALEKKDINRYYKINKLHTGLKIAFFLSDPNIEHLLEEHPTASSSIFNLGNASLGLGPLKIEYNLLGSDNHRNDPFTEILKEYFHKKKSKEGVKKGRWEREKAEREKKLAEIRAIAEEKYSNGSRDPHHDLAFKIKKKSEFEKISLKVIRRIVGSVAELYNLKSGISKLKNK